MPAVLSGAQWLAGLIKNHLEHAGPDPHRPDMLVTATTGTRFLDLDAPAAALIVDQAAGRYLIVVQPIVGA